MTYLKHYFVILFLSIYFSNHHVQAQTEKTIYHEKIEVKLRQQNKVKGVKVKFLEFERLSEDDFRATDYLQSPKDSFDIALKAVILVKGKGINNQLTPLFLLVHREGESGAYLYAPEAEFSRKNKTVIGKWVHIDPKTESFTFEVTINKSKKND